MEVSPPNENVVLWNDNRPWWERYQSLSYDLVTRSGNERQFAEMVRRCNNAGVRIYVDAVINHMTGEPPENVGTAGNTADFSNFHYPAVPYTREHFNFPTCGISDMDYGNNATAVSPPNENVVLWNDNRPWWERYQSLSYDLVTRSGNERQFAEMVRRCNNAGVRIYVDAVINHMTGEPPENVGTAGNTADFSNFHYPAVPYTREHFNFPTCGISDMDYGNNATAGSLAGLVLLLAAAAAHKNPYYAPGHSVNVHLFEWKWDDIADECERFLGPKGYGGIQVSPPNENVVLWNDNRPWWERYQSLSYDLVTRSGNERQFAEMVCRCNNAGVRIYVDAVINHMTGEPPENVGTAGNTADFSNFHYPAVPYTREHFNYPTCGISDMDYGNNATAVRNCELVGLKDLDQSNEHVRNMIVNFMNKLIDYGVAGFRIDAAKHMWPQDLRVIFDRLHDLNTDHGFPPNARPYIYQEVIDYGGEAVSRDEYTPLGAVTEFKVGSELSNAFRGNNALKWLISWGPQWGLLAQGDALTFIENHDNERGHGGAGGVLTYKDSKPYRAAIAFLLAHPYGEPQIMSSFEFLNSEIGPPMNSNGDTISPAINSDNSCGNGWVCQHRWRQIYAMVGFRNAAGDTGVNDWWDNGSNQIAFCRGGSGFIAFNGDYWDLNATFQTCVPAGQYCDVISGDKVGNACSGKTVTVGNDGHAQIFVGANNYDMMLAIHVGPESRL